MINIIGIDHIVLRTSRLSAMLDFYCRVLGCTLERETSLELGLTQLRAGTALIDLVTVDSELGRLGGEVPGVKSNNLDHFCLLLRKSTTAEIETHLQSAGIALGQFDIRYGSQGFGQSIYIRDPQGNVVELRSEV